MATRRNPPTPTGTTLGTVANTGGLGDLTGWKTKTVPLDEFWKGNYADFSHLIGSEGYVEGSNSAINNMQGVYDAYASGGNMADALTKDNRYGEGIQYDPKTGQVTYKYDDSGSSFGGLAQEFFTNPGFLMPASFGLATAFAPAGLASLGVEAGAIPALEGATAGAGSTLGSTLAGDAAMFAGANAGGLSGLTGSLATSQGTLAGADLAAAIEAGATGVEGAAMEYAASVGGSVTFNPATGELLTVAGQAFNPAIDYAAQALQKFNPGGTPRFPTNTPRDGGETARDLAQPGNAGDLAIPKGVAPGLWSRVTSGAGTIDDFAKIFGGIAPAVMGWFASNQNKEALENFTNQWMSMGQPYRDQLTNLYTQGGMEAWANSPQVQTTLNKTLEGAARALSVEGNPALNPFAQNTMRDEGLNTMWGMLTGEKQFLANAGGLSNFNAAAPQFALAGLNSGNNAWNAIGSGLSSVLNPQPTLEDYFKMMQQYGMTGKPVIA